MIIRASICYDEGVEGFDTFVPHTSSQAELIFILRQCVK